MVIAVSGATGFIGRRTSELLSASGHAVRQFSRRAGPPFNWDSIREEPRQEALAGCDAVVHLAGEPVAQRWTAEVKQRIRDSRVEGTRHLVRALAALPQRPEVLVCASAIGYYGDRGDEILTEASGPGVGFLPEVCQAWEEQADAAAALGIRVVKLRTGVVLGRGGGALQQMLPPFRWYVGGKLGSGRQWMSWIQLDDLAEMIAWMLNAPVRGPVNATAPNPLRNAEFTQALASVLHRPAFFTVPTAAIRALYGEMGSVVLASQHVLPEAAQNAGFRFRYTDARAALAASV